MTGTLMYTSDNDDNLPIQYTFDGPEKANEFIDATFPYLKNYQILVCSMNAEALKAAMEPARLPGQKHFMSYVHCLSLKGFIPEFSTGKRVLTMPSAEDAAKVAYLREPIASYGNPAGDQPGPAFLSAHQQFPIVSFLDGHVKSKDPLDLNKTL
jgi:hypothetical protein